MVVDLEKYEENDLGSYDNIEIKFKSGKSQRTKPNDYVKPENEKPEIFLKDGEVILFFNNSHKRPNLEDAETIYLEDL